MGKITLTAKELTNKKEELARLNEQFKKKVESLVQTEVNLGKMWEGDAKTAFHNTFNSDKAQMDNFYNAVRDYTRKLEEIVAKYMNAENLNVQTATNRSYK